LSSAADLTVSFARRPPLPWPRILLFLAIATAVLVDAAVMPQPWRGIEHRVILAVRWPTAAVLVLLLAAGLAGLALRSASTTRPAVADAEEPRFGPPRIAAQRSVKVVTVVGLEAGCGATTIAFNLAAVLAVMGERRGADDERAPVRSACLLSEGALPAALGVSSRELEEALAERPWDVRQEIVDHGVRHPSGCTVFCLKGGRADDDDVLRLVEQLNRHYDALIIDGAVSMPARLSPRDPTDVLLLVALPSEDSVDPAGSWITRVWHTRRETSTVMVVNRAPAWPPPPRELVIAFHHLALIPNEPRVTACDRQGLPWCLDDRLAATAQLTALIRMLFPALTGGGGTRAA
jgi:MinD-like ATPase involved in chromosome partitioning or flagellar assembly